jgi:hypothetical protein
MGIPLIGASCAEATDTSVAKADHRTIKRTAALATNSPGRKIGSERIRCPSRLSNARE